MKQLAPRGRQLKPRGQSGPAPVRTRDRVDTWRAWYKTAEWVAISWEVRLKAHFRCVRCKAEHPELTPICDLLGPLGKLEAVERRAAQEFVADHIRPHRGNRDRFFDRTNVQCMCATCHSRDKQREERANAYRGD